MMNHQNTTSAIQATIKNTAVSHETAVFLVRPVRFERMAFGVGVQRSIQLSYGRISLLSSIIQ